MQRTDQVAGEKKRHCVGANLLLAHLSVAAFACAPAADGQVTLGRLGL